MKYVVPSRQEAEYLAKADVIRVQARDHSIITDLYEKYPNAEVQLIRFPDDEVLDWMAIRTYNILGRGKFSLGLSDMNDMNQARKENYKHFYLGAVQTFQELADLQKGGVCGVYLDAPLFFQMDKVKEFGIPVYATANVAIQSSLFERADGVTGTWIRPEDVELYEPYIEIIDFSGNLMQQRALYRIYAEQHKWGGELGLLVHDLNYICTNRMIPSTLAESRLNCGQRCAADGVCHLCYRTLDLANANKMRTYLEATDLS